MPPLRKNPGSESAADPRLNLATSLEDSFNWAEMASAVPPARSAAFCHADSRSVLISRFWAIWARLTAPEKLSAAKRFGSNPAVTSKASMMVAMQLPRFS